VTPLDTYLAGKWQRPVPDDVPRLADVLSGFELHAAVGPVRALDLASMDNSIEIIRLGGELGLIFDHNYFAYVGDLLTCFLVDDSDEQHQHLNYVVNRFLLEESLQFNADELTAGLLHTVLLQDSEGLNPLGCPNFPGAKDVRTALTKVSDFQFRLFVAHEVGHVLAASQPRARGLAARRLMRLVEGLEGDSATRETHPNDTARDEVLTPTPAELRTWLHALDAAAPVDPLLEEFLCDNIAAEALGAAAARSSAEVALVADDLVFAIDAAFLLMWFLEALRFRIAALFDDDSGLLDTGPGSARARGHYFAFQFLLSYLAASGRSVEEISRDVEASARRADDLMAWLAENLEAAQSDANLEGVVKLGARSCVAYGVNGGRLHASVRRALGWPG
jgi:hypothetical protein